MKKKSQSLLVVVTIGLALCVIIYYAWTDYLRQTELADSSSVAPTIETDVVVPPHLNQLSNTAEQEEFSQPLTTQSTDSTHQNVDSSLPKNNIGYLMTFGGVFGDAEQLVLGEKAILHPLFPNQINKKKVLIIAYQDNIAFTLTEYGYYGGAKKIGPESVRDIRHHQWKHYPPITLEQAQKIIQSKGYINAIALSYRGDYLFYGNYQQKAPWYVFESAENDTAYLVINAHDGTFLSLPKDHKMKEQPNTAKQLPMRMTSSGSVVFDEEKAQAMQLTEAQRKEAIFIISITNHFMNLDKIRLNESLEVIEDNRTDEDFQKFYQAMQEYRNSHHKKDTLLEEVFSQ